MPILKNSEQLDVGKAYDFEEIAKAFNNIENDQAASTGAKWVMLQSLIQ